MEEWTDKDGRARNTLEVHATDMQFIGARSDESAAAPSSQPSSNAGRAEAQNSSPMSDTEPDVTDDDIPF